MYHNVVSVPQFKNSSKVEQERILNRKHYCTKVVKTRIILYFWYFESFFIVFFLLLLKHSFSGFLSSFARFQPSTVKQCHRLHVHTPWDGSEGNVPTTTKWKTNLIDIVSTMFVCSVGTNKCNGPLHLLVPTEHTKHCIELAFCNVMWCIVYVMSNVV